MLLTGRMHELMYLPIHNLIRTYNQQGLGEEQEPYPPLPKKWWLRIKGGQGFIFGVGPEDGLEENLVIKAIVSIRIVRGVENGMAIAESDLPSFQRIHKSTAVQEPVRRGDGHRVRFPPPRSLLYFHIDLIHLLTLSSHPPTYPPTTAR